MTIELYVLKDSYNKLFKTLSNKYVLTGELRSEQDVINPSITIDISDNAIVTDGLGNDALVSFRTEWYDINYCYIIELNRYYFITNITLLRKNIYVVDLHADVLSSFTEFIYNQKAYISRNELDYDVKLPDERRILKNTKTVYFYEALYTGPVGQSLVNTTFAISPVNSDNFPVVDLNIVLSTYDDNDSYEEYFDEAYKGNVIPTIDNIPVIDAGSFYQIMTLKKYVITKTTLSGVITELKSDSTLEGKIGGLYAYPFTPHHEVSESNLIIGNKQIKRWDNINSQTVNAKGYLTSTFSKDIIIADFVLLSSSAIQDFNTLEPYSLWEIYLPFYGWKEVKASSLIGYRLLVYYSVNYVDGSATVFLYNYTKRDIIFSAKCQIGVEIPLSTTNAKEVKDRRTTNAISTVLQVMGSGLAVAGGLATGNPLVMAGGVLAGTKAIGSSVTNEMTNYERGSIQYASESNALYSPMKVYIRHTQTEVQYSLDATFRAYNGGVCNKFKQLSACKGYTEVVDLPYIDTTSLTFIDDYMPTKNEIDEIITLLKKGVIFPTT